MRDREPCDAEGALEPVVEPDDEAVEFPADGEEHDGGAGEEHQGEEHEGDAAVDGPRARMVLGTVVHASTLGQRELRGVRLKGDIKMVPATDVLRWAAASVQTDDPHVHN